MGIVGPLLLLGGAVFVVAKRCELLGMCGDSEPDSGTISGEEVTSGGVDETTSNLDEQGNWAGGSSKGCCVCEMQGDRVKCQKHGGAWYNPPAMNGVSNDQSVELSLQACNATCGSSSTSLTDREKNEVKGVKCASGYSSVNGKCVKLGANRSKGGSAAGTGSRMSPKPSSTPRTPARRPSTGNLGESGTRYVQQPVRATGSASYLNKGSGYKPGGGTYYTYRSYFVDPYNPRPFRLYHRIAN